jgi:membrane associated rhomboid family serine protease
VGLADRDYLNTERSFRARTASAWPTPMVWAVLIAIGGTWLVSQYSWRIGAALMLSVENGLASREPWRWATFPLVHFAPIHAFIGGLAVYLFLPQLEREWGWVRALSCFLLGNLFGAGLYALFVTVGGVELLGFYGCGAGALAVLTAAAYRLPHEYVFEYVPNRLAAVLVGVMWVLFIVATRQVTDLVHLVGIPFGMLVALASVWRPRRRRWGKHEATLPMPSVRRGRAYANSQIEQSPLSLDEVLEKVSREGIDSLSPDERRTLEIATERRRRKD